MDLKETLQHYRKQQGLSQIELAEALDVSRQTISKWETGMALPSAENLLSLSKLYGVPVDALLNGKEAESVLERIPIGAPPECREKLPRRHLLAQILGVLFLFDLLAFLTEFYLGILVVRAGGILCPLLRLFGCGLIGLAFARRNRDRPVNRSATRLLGLAALAVGVYVFLMPVPLLWRLYDRVAWIGSAWDAPLPSNPVFFFLGYTLFDEYTFASHLLLAAVFLLARLLFTRNAVLRTPLAQSI